MANRLFFLAATLALVTGMLAAGQPEDSVAPTLDWTAELDWGKVLSKADLDPPTISANGPGDCTGGELGNSTEFLLSFHESAACLGRVELLYGLPDLPIAKYVTVAVTFDYEEEPFNANTYMYLVVVIDGGALAETVFQDSGVDGTYRAIHRFSLLSATKDVRVGLRAGDRGDVDGSQVGVVTPQINPTASFWLNVTTMEVGIDAILLEDTHRRLERVRTDAPDGEPDLDWAFDGVNISASVLDGLRAGIHYLSFVYDSQTTAGNLSGPEGPVTVPLTLDRLCCALLPNPASTRDAGRWPVTFGPNPLHGQTAGLFEHQHILDTQPVVGTGTTPVAPGGFPAPLGFPSALIAALVVGGVFLAAGVGTVSTVVARRRRRRDSSSFAAQAQLEEKRRQDLEVVIHGLTHDLKTPLISMAWLAKEIEEATAGAEGNAVRENLKRMQANVGGMKDLVQALLELGRLERHDGLLEEPVELRALFEDVVEELRPLMQRRGTHIIRKGQPVSIRGDGRLLRQALRNLVENAVKHGKESDGHVVVGLGDEHADRTGRPLYIRIEDDGPGVPAEERPRLFQLFQRGASAQRGIEGTGVGLALVKRIIEAHGGRVQIEDSSLGGACFRVVLPASRIVRR